jgi:hypothetical protein
LTGPRRKAYLDNMKIVREAVERYGSNRVAAIEAITRALLASDAATVWEFFKPDRDYRLQASYDRMLRESRAGQPLYAATAARHPTPARDAAGSGQPEIAQSGQTLRTASGPHVPQTVLAIAANSLLRSVLIDGRPVGECTAGRARSWAKARGRESRFVYLLAYGLQDSQIIGMSKTEDDARIAHELADKYDNG